MACQLDRKLDFIVKNVKQVLSVALKDTMKIKKKFYEINYFFKSQFFASSREAKFLVITPLFEATVEIKSMSSLESGNIGNT